MADILIRNLTQNTVNKLKARAAENGRSLQSEAKAILERSAAELSFAKLRRNADALSRRFADRQFSDSVDLLREDRQR